MRMLEIELHGAVSISYTHLDVYKRQGLGNARPTSLLRLFEEISGDFHGDLAGFHDSFILPY